jgi:hypothetical protein
MSDALERILEECGDGLIEVLAQHSLGGGGAEEIHLKCLYRITNDPAKV